MYKEAYNKMMGLRKEALAGKGYLKGVIKQLFSMLRTKKARNEFIDALVHGNTRGSISSAPKLIGGSLDKKRQLNRLAQTFKGKNHSPITKQLFNALPTLRSLPKNIFGNVSQKDAKNAADQVWHRIRNAYIPSANRMKTPLDKWY